MPKKFISFLACMVIAAWLGFVAVEAFHDEEECEDEDCMACFAIQSAQSVFTVFIKTANVSLAVVLVYVSLLIFIKILYIRPITPVLYKVRLDL